MKIILARHGETQWNKLKKLQGRLDSPLTDEGILQAHSLAEKLKTAQVKLIISSPLKRAEHTAQICEKVLNVERQLDAQLVERDFGLWQAEYFSELKSEKYFTDVFYKVNHQGPPDGETGIACAQRIQQALLNIARTQLNGIKSHLPLSNRRLSNQLQSNELPVEGCLLVITHGDAIRCLLSLLSVQGQVDAYSQYGNGKTFPLYYHAELDELQVLVE
ncbi:histidine phosphatase family protein [Aliikangiella maris]|uniref:Histidine phosphatase family protein n=2 Tax=Aliikangiella maris TaxID=3162458 RepID=A0ABV3MQX7_9GAMM